MSSGSCMHKLQQCEGRPAHCLKLSEAQLPILKALTERPKSFFQLQIQGAQNVLQVKEIKNGRLAMIAMLGYAVQGAVTRQGPLQNLLDFVADPAHNNVLSFLP